MIPPEVSFGNPSAAERRLHRLLREIRLDGYTALHSVGLSQHDYKLVAEIDFLLVGPDGLFVLEVKGGRVALRNGVWIFTDRFGEDHRKGEGPFDQGKSAAYSLVDRLKDLLGAKTMDRVVFGWASVFPDIDFGEASVEWDPAQVLDRDDTTSPAALETALGRLVDHWWRRSDRRRRLDEAAVAAIVQAVRPDFEKLPSLRRRTDDIDDRAFTLTGAQFRYLEATDRNQRVLCDGGAGTGKTFLAVEVARREAAQGRTVTVTCRSPVLAAYIADQPGVGPDYGIEVLPAGRLGELGRPADVLVVDEAQDLVNAEDLSLLDASVSHGLAGGRWRFFLDRNHQAGVLGTFDEEALCLVDDGVNTIVHLPDNCRNTVDIVREVVSVTGADVGASLSGGGPPVLWRWWTGAEDGAGDLAGHVQALFEDGVDPHQVTILTAVDPANDPVVSALPSPIRRLVVPLTANNVHRAPRNRIGAVRTALFKGLENSFVCVTDIGGLNADLSEVGVAELYVAMTRPRAGLYMGLPMRLHSVLSDLGRQHGRIKT